MTRIKIAFILITVVLSACSTTAPTSQWLPIPPPVIFEPEPTPEVTPTPVPTPTPIPVITGYFTLDVGYEASTGEGEGGGELPPPP